MPEQNYCAAQVDEACDMVESALVQLENICEEQEFQRNERQEAYGEQFAQDVDFFKKHGKPGRLPSTSESEKQLDIADIEIEDDPEALDEFLASTASDTELSEAKDASESDLVSDTDAPSAQIISDITSPDIENSTFEVGSLAKDSSETSEVTAPAESVSSSSNEGQDGGAHKNKTVELTEDAISKDKQSETAEKRDDDGKEMEGPEESENAEKNDDEMEGAQESGKATSPDEDVKEEMEGATDKQSENNEMPSDAVKDTKSDT
ncbi:hypothetical protein MAR_026317 [Mya arenaria]|uniref:Uncharacterized protein n=1 Tax=Mya arenaria TaxID=6604 RepID=A0ABY7ESL5_MYAAR|nr:hypothetical protein MAR_026317 [Mya arenaria]